MKITDEKLSTFLDGELGAEEMASIREAIESDSELGMRVEKFCKVDQVVDRAYSDINNQPVPDRILNLLEPQSVQSKPNSGNYNWGGNLFAQLGNWPGAIAASLALAIGIGAGFQLAREPNSAIPFGVPSAGLLAEGNPISATLETGISAETVYIEMDQLVAITPVLTFKSQAGNYCREFTLSVSQHGSRGIACRNDGQWMVEMMVSDASVNTEADAYVTASANVVNAFDNFVDSLSIEPPLGSEAEFSLIEREWR